MDQASHFQEVYVSSIDLGDNISVPAGRFSGDYFDRVHIAGIIRVFDGTISRMYTHFYYVTLVIPSRNVWEIVYFLVFLHCSVWWIKWLLTSFAKYDGLINSSHSQPEFKWESVIL